MNIFKDRIKELRKKNNESQETLGKAIGVSRYAVLLYEKGTSYPDMEGFIALADHFKVSLDYLAGRTDNPEVNRRPYSPEEDKDG